MSEITVRFFQTKTTAMKNPSVETELIGTIKYLDSNQKSNVLSFIKNQLRAKKKVIAKKKALRDIRLALKGGNLAF